MAADRTRRIDRDLAVALVSGLIGVLALGVSTYNVYLQHKQVRAQVWPRLSFMPSLNDEQGFYFALENDGIGPAQIHGVRVLLDGKPVPNWEELAKRLTGKEPTQWGYSTITGTVLPPGRVKKPLVTSDQELGKKIFEAQHRIDVEICYCSALDDCWLLQHNDPNAVSACPRFADAFEQ